MTPLLPTNSLLPCPPGRLGAAASNRGFREAERSLRRTERTRTEGQAVRAEGAGGGGTRKGRGIEAPHPHSPGSGFALGQLAPPVWTWTPQTAFAGRGLGVTSRLVCASCGPQHDRCAATPESILKLSGDFNVYL